MRHAWLAGGMLVALAQAAVATPLQPNDGVTTTPIKHVIVILGENRTFDHVFGTYQPKPGQSVFNILSEGIVKADGSPGPNFAKAAQAQAEVTGHYQIAPEKKALYATLPAPMTDGAPSAPSDTRGPPFVSATVAAAVDGGILPADQHLLLSGATGLPRGAIDTRLPNATSLPNGPYPLTPALSYDDFTANPTHRFFQMWQQMDCAAAHASAVNPSGCRGDLFAFVETSVAAGSNGKPPPPDFSNRTTREGAAALAFYNMAQGDAPYLKQLADDYAISDNYHQPIIGGSGPNHVMLGTGDAIWYSDASGAPAIPPASEIENPDPMPGTNNWYTQEGYASSYVACADHDAPGVAAITDYLAALPYHPKPNCEPGHYYLVNNFAPGYLGNGALNNTGRIAVPPSRLPTIGDVLLAKHVSFRYYGEDWNGYAQGAPGGDYCDICNFLQYSASIMTDPARRAEHIRDLPDLYNDIVEDTLPAVSFVKPSGINDGHPQSSKLDLFEAFIRKIVLAVQSQPQLWAGTAILITFDEGGGYWDSGYVQPLDFFGDGPRIPLIVVSPYATGGRVVHSYTDHVSILKFIEKNWSVSPVSNRSRDNLPNPFARAENPYVPTNPPAIGDLMDLFNFK